MLEQRGEKGRLRTEPRDDQMVRDRVRSNAEITSLAITEAGDERLAYAVELAVDEFGKERQQPRTPGRAGVGHGEDECRKLVCPLAGVLLGVRSVDGIPVGAFVADDLLVQVLTAGRLRAVRLRRQPRRKHVLECGPSLLRLAADQPSREAATVRFEGFARLDKDTWTLLMLVVEHQLLTEPNTDPVGFQRLSNCLPPGPDLTRCQHDQRSRLPLV